MRRYCTVAVVLGIALSIPAAANAATFTVDRDSDDPAAGDCSVAGGPCTLRAAVARANAADGADTIVLGARTILLTHAEGDLDVTEDLTISGSGAGASVIDGSGLEERIISAREGTRNLTLEDVRLTGGQDGAVDSEADVLLIDRSRIDGAAGADEIVEQDPSESPSTLIVRDSQIDGNTISDDDEGDEPAAIVQFDPGSVGGTMIVERSSLTGNTIGSERDVAGVLDFSPHGDEEEVATVRISDSAITDNHIGNAGVSGLRIATFDVGTVDVQIVRSTFARNTAAGAVGFYPEEPEAALTASAEEGAATLLVTESTFDGNTSVQGGAIDISPSRTVDSGVVVTRSTFTGNRARFDQEDSARGGAINLWRGALTVENSTFTGNVVEGGSFRSGGGAIAVNGPAAATLTHVTIAGNRAEGRARGGGIAGPMFDTIGAESFVPVTVTNSIVAGNLSDIVEENLRRAAATRPDDCDAPVGTGGGNLEGATTCGFRDATDKQDADPKLGTLAENGGPTRTMALAADSPAVNAARAGACLATDQRGIARTAAACDSGAYELVPAGTQPVTQPRPAGGVLGAEASSEPCLSVRRFKIRLRVPRGEEVRRAIVLVNGNPAAVKRGKRLTAVIDLRGLKKARYKVKITLHLKGGGKVSGVRRYWTCTPAIRWTRPPKV